MLTFSWEVRQGSVFKPVRNPPPRDGLLAHAGNHLRDVDEGALGAAESHDERAVGVVQLLLADIASRLPDNRELLEDDCLECLLHRAAWLSGEPPILVTLNILITFCIATKKCTYKAKKKLSKS